MPPLEEIATGKAYWRSLEELADTPRFRRLVRQEFPGFEGALSSPVSRRNFLKLMAASLALAGLTGCRWPKEEILPYASRPAGRSPGDPVQYATSMDLAGAARGLLVTSYDGRPTKVEGNPLHPETRGACDSYSQAAVLDLYDPDRSRSPVRREGGQELTQTWREFETAAEALFGPLREREGYGLHVLAGASSSSSLADMRRRFFEVFPRAKWYEYEAISRDAAREGSRMVHGAPHRAHLHLEKAEVVVSLDSDFLMDHPSAVRNAREFARGRRADERDAMTRLHVVESGFSLTGGMAEHRHAVAPSALPAVARRLAAEVLSGRGVTVPAALSSAARRLRSAGGEEEAPFAAAMARDLLEHRGRSLIVAGDRQSPEVHAVVHLLNVALGNAGRTVTYSAEPDPDRPTHAQAVADLASEIRRGKVDVLVILGGNPVYDAPADLDFAQVLERPKETIHLGLHRDETAGECSWHLPRAHFLEAWDDTRAWDGTLSPVQPLIEPLYDGRTPAELLALMTGDDLHTAYDITRRTLEGIVGSFDFERKWRRALHDGVVPETAFPTVEPGFDEAGAVSAAEALASYRSPRDGRPEILLTRDYTLDDGRYANNGWLQEMPDPITKVTWDNAAVMSIATARSLGVSEGDRVRIEKEGRSITLPVYRLPGQADGCIGVSLGYGRRRVGRVGEGVGVNTYALRTAKEMHVVRGATVEKAGGKYELATTQDHHVIDSVGMKERAERVGWLVRESTLEGYREHPEFAKHMGPHHPPIEDPWKPHDYSEGRKWGMAIDLNACIGCGACTVACMAENNIPVVGRDEVAEGREMNWIRIDRYFSGPPEAPEMVHQPLTCHQCENAPCEQVCPVAATVHGNEGLNLMVYNRCVGTRYCSNNCPYKVRRFNFFNNHKNLSELQEMQYNPEVTVRGRGVMEKCTFCIQRIRNAEIDAKNERRPLEDGEITPACQQACPTQAIVFGDLNNPKSRVRKAHDHPRSYAILEELNVKPRTRYLARLRNPSGGSDEPSGNGDHGGGHG
jgi:MoCo/4Fe-4S cofactor protein with predicted Tat translocation signal